MRIFVTGGTGYIGSAVLESLAETEHHVTALARTEEAAEVLRHLGAEPVLGDLASPESYGLTASEHDAILHIGLAPGADGAETDRIATGALLDAARSGGVSALVYTSGVWVLGDTGDDPADEDASTARPGALVSWRPERERTVLEAATDELATAVLRPGIVYGGKRGIVARLFETAKRDGAATYFGDGQNRWSLVHRADLAELYRLVIERRARGVFHGVDGNALRVEEVARAASHAVGESGATRSIPLADARARSGPFADALCLDQVVVAPRSRALGWTPTRSSFASYAAEAYEEWRHVDFETDYARTGPPPWDIGRPQPAFYRLEEEGRIQGKVLDLGCGTGENALFLASCGHEVEGLDIAAIAIKRARRKAEARSLDARFFVGDVLDLEEVKGTFDTAIDSGVHHIFDARDRARYAENVAGVLRPGGRLFLLCFSDKEPGEWGPNRLTQDDIRAAFADGWEVESIETSRFVNFRRPEGSRAWLATLLRR